MIGLVHVNRLVAFAIAAVLISLFTGKDAAVAHKTPPSTIKTEEGSQKSKSFPLVAML